jgi:hypothetical protein
MKDALIRVNYKFFKGEKERSYKIIEYLKNKSIIYAPTNSHPFKGSVKISIIKSSIGCTLKWAGNYSNVGILQMASFKLYEYKFFKSLTRNLMGLTRQ